MDTRLEITGEMEQQLLNISHKWNNCFTDIRIKSKPYICDNLEVLEGYNKYESIAIDGMSGTGKSTLISTFNRSYAKINLGSQATTKGPFYNKDINRAMFYLEYQYMNYVKQSIWDRGSFSNLVFRFVDLLMHECKYEKLNLYHWDRVNSMLYGYMYTTGFFSVLKEFKKRDNYIPTIYLVNSDMDLLKQTILRRKEKNDLSMYDDTNYHWAQYFAYTFVANKSDSACFDIGTYYERGMNLDTIQRAIKYYCDVEIKQPAIEYKKFNEEEVYNMFPDDSLEFMYKFSRK